MSGTPTEAEIQTQWTNVVRILEETRTEFDTNLAGASGSVDTLLQSLEGEYTPTALGNAVASFRDRCSSLVDQSTALEFLGPLLEEYAAILAADATDGFGSNYQDLSSIFSALYEWFHANSLTVESRAITYDSSATAGASNVGNGGMSRLHEDHNGYPLEFCHVERKIFRCRQDQNTGTKEHAELFEVAGSQPSRDALQRSSFGSGVRGFLRAHHAGGGEGGSLLKNSSFSTYDVSATPRFAGWTESAGVVTQDTTNYYRSHPGATTDASMVMTGGAGTITIKQTLDDMRISRIDPEVPYFCRIMVNGDSASGGNVVLRMGTSETVVAISALTAGWDEVIIADDETWPRQFNEDPLDIEIAWESSTSGTLLIDDAIFAPWDLVDGTYWFLRANNTSPVPWLVDDTLSFTDTGGAPATGKVQWWNFVAGLGYLPAAVGTPDITEP